MEKKEKLESRLKKYVVANVLAMVGMSCYILADTFFISIAGGTNGITALNLSLPIYAIIFAIGDMIGLGAATRYTIYKSSENKEHEYYFFNSIAWIMIISIPFIMIGLLYPEQVLRIMGGTNEIIAIGKNYIRIAMLFTPFFMLNFVFTSFTRNDNAPKTAMIATIVSSISNILLDYILMFPLKLGIVGAALATAASPVISITICSFYLFSKRSTLVKKISIPSVKRLLKSMNLGISGFVTEISSGITTTVFNFLMLSLVGNIGVAAYGIIANVSLVGISIFNGIAQGTQPLASEAHGKNALEDKNRIKRLSNIIAISLGIILILVVELLSSQIVAIFNSEGSVILQELAEKGMKIYFIGFLFAGINITNAGFFSATENPIKSSIIAIGRGMVAIILFAIVLSQIFGVIGLWLSFPIAEASITIVTCLWTIMEDKKSTIAC